MINTCKIFNITFIVAIVILSIIMFVMLDDNTVKYDCNMLIGGWHPDIPKSITEQCTKGKMI